MNTNATTEEKSCKERLETIQAAQHNLKSAICGKYIRTDADADIVLRKDKKHGVEKICNKETAIDWTGKIIEHLPKVAIVHERYKYTIMNAALLLAEQDIPIGVPIVVVALNDIEEWRSCSTWGYRTEPVPELAEFHEVLIDNADIVFDVRANDFPFEYVEEDTGHRWTRTLYEFQGRCLPKPHIMDVRDKFISTVSDFWGGKFISGYNEKRATSGGQLALDKAVNLVKALSMGRIEFDTDTLKKVKAPGWHREAVNNVRFSDNTLPEPWENLDENIAKARAVLDFWDNAADYYRFSLRLDRVDLDDVEQLEELCRMTGEMIGVDDYLDTYAAGVPAEDILA